MGVYIEVAFRCPGCKSPIDIQTYGEHLQYSASDLPLHVARQIKDEIVYCENCSEEWQVAFKVPKVQCELVTPSESLILVSGLKQAGTFCSTCGDPQRIRASGGLICTNIHIEDAKE